MIIKDITEWLTTSGYEYEFIGDESAEIVGFSSLRNYKESTITFVNSADNYERSVCKASIRIAVVQKGLELSIPNQIITDNSREVFFSIVSMFWGTNKKVGYIGKGTVITDESMIDSTVYIGENCSIVGKVRIGANSIIENNVSIISDVTIGSDCIIHSGVVIGSDGFGFDYDKNGLPIKVEHFGGVDIGNRVEIGANTCIDRGTIDNTVICDDVKIDNLVHIAHNTYLSRGALVVAGAIVCGSARLGENSYIAPGAIVKNQLEIGSNALVGLGAVATKSVDEFSVVAGVPAKEIRKIRKGDK